MVDEARESGARMVSLGGEPDPGTPAAAAGTRRGPAQGPADHEGRGLRPDPAGHSLRRPGARRWRRSTRGSDRSACTSTARTADVAEGVLRQTTSGGACVNICALQGALPSLGFGGIGQSGSGRHHGIEGFREFSNPRGVVVRGTGDLADAFLPALRRHRPGHRRRRVRPRRPADRRRRRQCLKPEHAHASVQPDPPAPRRSGRTGQARPDASGRAATCCWPPAGSMRAAAWTCRAWPTNSASPARRCSATSAAAKRCSAPPWRS